MSIETTRSSSGPIWPTSILPKHGQLPRLQAERRLVDSNKGTLLAIADRDQFEDAVMGFEIYGANDKGEQYANTNWPIRRDFPTFVYAVLEHLANRGRQSPANRFSRANPSHLRAKLPPTKSKSAPHPARKPSLAAMPTANFAFPTQGNSGPYEVLEQNRVAQRFTVNLFDPAESDIRPATENSIQIGHVTVAGQAGYEPVRREFWKWLALGALVVLCSSGIPTSDGFPCEFPGVGPPMSPQLSCHKASQTPQSD